MTQVPHTHEHPFIGPPGSGRPPAPSVPPPGGTSPPPSTTPTVITNPDGLGPDGNPVPPTTGSAGGGSEAGVNWLPWVVGGGLALVFGPMLISGIIGLLGGAFAMAMTALPFVIGLGLLSLVMAPESNMANAIKGGANSLLEMSGSDRRIPITEPTPEQVAVRNMNWRPDMNQVGQLSSPSAEDLEQFRTRVMRPVDVFEASLRDPNNTNIRNRLYAYTPHLTPQEINSLPPEALPYLNVSALPNIMQFSEEKRRLLNPRFASDAQLLDPTILPARDNLAFVDPERFSIFNRKNQVARNQEEYDSVLTNLSRHNPAAFTVLQSSLDDASRNRFANADEHAITETIHKQLEAANLSMDRISTQQLRNIYSAAEQMTEEQFKTALSTVVSDPRMTNRVVPISAEEIARGPSRG